MPCLPTSRAFRLVVFTLLALFSLPLMAASAQDNTGEPETYEEKVAALLCVDRDCVEFGPRIADFTINVVDIDTGDLIDSCVTDAATAYEGCLVTIPVDAHWTLSWDESQVPEGYEYRGLLMGVSGGAFGSITYVGFIPLEPDAPQEPGHVVVQAALCTDATCDEFSELLDGFLISAIDPETGETFSECMTGNQQQALDHQCIVDVPADGAFALDWVDDQVPDGYDPFGEPFETDGGTVLTLGFVPSDVQSDEDAAAPPVSQLPSTGATTPEGSESSNLGSITLAVVTLVLAGTALHLRRR